MSTFEVKVYPLIIEPHPNADLLELARVGDYRAVVGKNDFRTGDWGVYIPEAAVLPPWLIAAMHLEGRLAGKQYNRVKAVKLRGSLSQGLVYPVRDITPDNDDPYIKTETGIHHVNMGMDVTDVLGIIKYEPPIPIHMAGEVTNVHGYTIHYDIENVKKYPDVLIEGEQVAITEKLHGTFCMIGRHSGLNNPDLIDGNVIIASKGLGAQGLVFKNNENNKNNIYVRAFESTREEGRTIIDLIDNYIKCEVFSYLSSDTPFYILGEIFGKGIQDLTYRQQQPTFRVFDIYVGQPGQGRFLDYKDKLLFCAMLGLPAVPILYQGPFSKEKMDELTVGNETVSGFEHNIREGIVITSERERYDNEIGRVILKSINEQYLLRRGETTEFE